MKLNLGCGWKKLKGFVNVDFRKEVKPNKCFDLNQKFPIKTNSTEEIICINTIEHLNNPIGFVEECWRVLKPKGSLFITSSHISQIESQGELDHKRTGLGVNSFHYCCGQSLMNREYYSKARFELKEINLIVHPLLQSIAFLSPIKYEKYLSRLFSARSIEFTLIKRVD